VAVRVRASLLSVPPSGERLLDLLPRGHLSRSPPASCGSRLPQTDVHASSTILRFRRAPEIKNLFSAVGGCAPASLHVAVGSRRPPEATELVLDERLDVLAADRREVPRHPPSAKKASSWRMASLYALIDIGERLPARG
jgi:hypothetical protein